MYPRNTSHETNNLTLAETVELHLLPTSPEYIFFFKLQKKTAQHKQWNPKKKGQKKTEKRRRFTLHNNGKKGITEKRRRFPAFKKKRKRRRFRLTIDVESLGRDASPDRSSEAAIADGNGVSPVPRRTVKRQLERPREIVAVLHQCSLRPTPQRTPPSLTTCYCNEQKKGEMDEEARLLRHCYCCFRERGELVSLVKIYRERERSGPEVDISHCPLSLSKEVDVNYFTRFYLSDYSNLSKSINCFYTNPRSIRKSNNFLFSKKKILLYFDQKYYFLQKQKRY